MGERTGSMGHQCTRTRWPGVRLAVYVPKESVPQEPASVIVTKRHYFGAATCNEGTCRRRNRFYGSSVHPSKTGEGRAILGAPDGGDFVMDCWPDWARPRQQHTKKIG